MNLSTKTIDELIDLALRTTCLDEMLFLQRNPSMNVRRALARNRNLDDKILRMLTYDPVQNVSYMASQHPKNSYKRDFEEPRPCVTCDKDEKGLYCESCPNLTKYSQ